VPAPYPYEGAAYAFAAAEAAAPEPNVVRSCEYVLNTVGPARPRPGPAVMLRDGTLNENAAVAEHASMGSIRAAKIIKYALLSLIIQHPLNHMSY
jgi:hypothetical protein